MYLPKLVTIATLLTASTLSLTELGQIHFEESYQILHGKLDIGGTENLLTALDNYGLMLLNTSNSMHEMPSARSIQKLIGHDIIDRARTMRRKLDTATFSIANDKRGLDFLGDWIHQLTGVPGPYEHEKEKSAINHIKSALTNQDKLNMQMNHDVSKIINKINAEEHQIVNINRHFNHLYEKITIDNSDIHRSLSLMTMKFLMDTKIDAIELSITDIQFILLEAKNHHLSPRLINSTELQNRIKIISADSRELTPIIEYSKSRMYYALPLTRAILISKAIHVFTRIPMIRTRQSMTLHPIDYETVLENGRNSRDYNYILSATKLTHFSTMTTEQLVRAIEIPGQGLLSDIRPVEIETNIQNCTDALCASKICHVTQIRKNTFVFKLPSRTTSTTYCSTNDTTHEEEIGVRGTLVLGPDCSLKTRFFFIHKVMSYDNSAFFTYSPSVQLQDLSTIFSETESIDDNIKNINITLADHRDDFDELNSTIKDIKDENYKRMDSIRKIDTVTGEIKLDNSTHWGLSIGAISLGGICLVAAITLCLVMYCMRKRLQLVRGQADLSRELNMQLREQIELSERARSGF